MTPLNDKMRKTLEETHILVLGSQIILGFKFQSAFQPGFEHVSPHGRWLFASSLGLLLLTFLLLVLPTPVHRIVEGGNDTPTLYRVASRAACAALFPFALALAIDFWLPLENVFGIEVAVTIGCGMGAAALFLWYGLEVLHKRRGSSAMRNRSAADDGNTSLKDKINQILIEARIILPGVQALLGFQLVAYFTNAFEHLPFASQVVHTASTVAMGLAVMLLMTPAAYHRIVDEGEDTPHFDRFAARLILGALLPLALGLAGESYVVLLKVSQDMTFAVLASTGTAVALLGAWVILPALIRVLRRPSEAAVARHRG
jgi:Family of unknown function (DUF6328)